MPAKVKVLRHVTQALVREQGGGCGAEEEDGGKWRGNTTQHCIVRKSRWADEGAAGGVQGLEGEGARKGGWRGKEGGDESVSVYTWGCGGWEALRGPAMWQARQPAWGAVRREPRTGHTRHSRHSATPTT